MALSEIDCTQEDALTMCPSNICGEDGFCTTCSTNSDCPNNYACDNYNGQEDANNYCVVILEINCDEDYDCPTKLCNQEKKCNYCYFDAGSYNCNVDSELCISGYCTDIAPEGTDGSCGSDADCTATNYCEFGFEDSYYC
jgi:hypothetical protein